jgi:acetate kinase
MRNQSGATVVSSDNSRVRVFVIHTNEEMMIARHAARRLAAMRGASAAAYVCSPGVLGNQSC